MHIFHCWHKIEDSERKIPYHTRCKIKKQPEFIHKDYIECTIKYKCCICGKIKRSNILRDYDIKRAIKYKTD